MRLHTQHSPPCPGKLIHFYYLCQAILRYANDEFFPGYIFLLTVWRKAECHSIDSSCFWPWLELFLLHICAVSKSVEDISKNSCSWFHLQTVKSKTLLGYYRRWRENWNNCRCQTQHFPTKLRHISTCCHVMKENTILMAWGWKKWPEWSPITYVSLHSQPHLMGYASNWTIVPLNAKSETRSRTRSLSNWQAKLKDGISAAWD